SFGEQRPEVPYLVREPELVDVVHRASMLDGNAHGAEFDTWRTGAGTKAMGVDPTADPATPLQDLDDMSTSFQLIGRHQAGYACPDYSDLFCPLCTGDHLRSQEVDGRI